MILFVLVTLFAFSPKAAVATTATSTTRVTTVAPELRPADELFVLLNCRASLMRAVAIAMWRSGQPIEDLKREAQVVERTKSAASREGLNNVTATTRAQIQLAKLIQTRWHRRWAREGLADEYSISLNVLRARLDMLDAQILSSFKESLPTLRENALHSRLKTVFLRRFRVGDLRDEERLLLFNALLQVRQTLRDNDGSKR